MIKICIVFAVVTIVLLLQITLFLTQLPTNTSSHYPANTSSSLFFCIFCLSCQLILVKGSLVKNKDFVISYETYSLSSPSVNNSSTPLDQHVLVILHGILGSRKLKHPQESQILNYYLQQISSPQQLIVVHLDRIGYGSSTPVNKPLDQFLQQRTIVNMVKEELPLVLKGLKLSSNKESPIPVSLIAMDTATTAALSIASQSDIFGKEVKQQFRIFKIVLLSPVAPFISEQEYVPLLEKQSANLFTKLQQQVLSSSPFRSLVMPWAWHILTQTGFVTYHLSWWNNLQRLVSPNEFELLQNWKIMTNESFVELYRQGSLQQLSELLLLTKEWNLPLQKVDTPLKIITSTNENIFSSPAIAQYIKSKLPQQNQVLVEVAENIGSFQLLEQKFTSAVEFILQEELSKNSQENWKQQLPIVIVGGGLSGLSAAIEAVDSGATNVILIEKEKQVAGNSWKAASGINGIFTAAQLANKIEDSYELFTDDTMKSGRGLANSSLVQALIQDSTSAISFLESKGVKLDLLSQCGGHSRARTHRSSPDPTTGQAKNIGVELISKLLQHVQQAEYSQKIKIWTQTTVTSLITVDKKVVGITYVSNSPNATSSLPQNLFAKATILTTGGYAADFKQLLPRYVPNISHLPTTNGEFATGDGIKLVLDRKELKVGLADMDKVQVHPTCFVNPQNATAKTLFLAAEALRAHGGILVNYAGKRFANELEMRDTLSDAIFANNKQEVDKGPVTTYMLLNEKVAQDFGIKLLGFYQSKGFITKFDNLQELVKKYSQIDGKELQKTLKEYNMFAEKENSKDLFGKTKFHTKFVETESIYVAKITPCIHYTMGGLRFDVHGRVLNEQQQPIEGLFAAGEVTGSLHGANRLAGNSLLECVVFGRRAAQFISKQQQ